ncbi:hypothetical protein MLP_02330 [Microlunatus phosphovorus NM-1]|uniref:Uncharacterized protein n=1 Tax=Microlunatus phosphovorus (strain ATCC 700054 / DSM 10555 / JCM 9379 / NBRC 101784 / NCIMB 13414 / VKM Ac-1990 / NM-1) TaxID=1032480 RepID=F5XHV2_MICPN|nr:type II toxin-antitoxin system HipA family toxin [Microlunatus phosphovorus]BAK33247.1 hypothetical protein MLP_02330 [Microlunatus phosphovorus NM-1]
MTEPSTGPALLVVLYGRVIGQLDRGPRGPVFHYDPEYPRNAPPLSVNMPPSGTVYPSRVVLPFLEGMLPENAEVRRRMARELDVQPDALSLLSKAGWDCPGAVQFTLPERLEEMLRRPGLLVQVTDSDIAARLDRLRDDDASWTRPGEHWSLAGQQSKFALARTEQGWAEAKGTAPTTHIIKPGIGRLAYQALVEHATMRAAATLGVNVARTTYTEFAGRPAIVVERFDRLRGSRDQVLRLHQEDMCQALGRMPERKYEENSGPSVREMVKTLSLHAYEKSRNISGLLDFVLINYAAEAPDGHAKNLSIQILPSASDIRLAPLYDLASALPYDRGGFDRDLALSIGGRRRINDIHAKQWARLARELHISEDEVRHRARELVAGFPDAFGDALAEVGTPAADQVWNWTSDRARRHAEMCLTRLSEPSAD